MPLFAGISGSEFRLLFIWLRGRDLNRRCPAYCKPSSVFPQIYPLFFLHFRRFHHSSSGFLILKWNLCRSVRGTSHKVTNTGLLPFVDSHCKENQLCTPNNISSRHHCSGALYHLHIIKILIELIYCFYIHTLEYIRISIQCRMYVFMPKPGL